LRPSDLMRILVPWHAFGDLEQAKILVDSHERQLILEVEENRDQRMADIEDAFGPVLAPLAKLEEEQALLEALDLKIEAVVEAINPGHPYFDCLVALKEAVNQAQAAMDAAGRAERATLKAKLNAVKKQFDTARKELITALKERTKQVKRAVKELRKLQEERDAREQEITLAAEREIAHLNEAANDLRRILDDPDEARRYFAVVDEADIKGNEFNLNLPRYVDTFEPETLVPLDEAMTNLNNASQAANEAQIALQRILAAIRPNSAGANGC